MTIEITQSNLAFERNAAQNVNNVQPSPEAGERLQNEPSSDRFVSATLESENNANANQNSADIEDISRVESAELEVAVAEVSEFVQSTRRNLDFSFNEEANRSIVRVTDTDTGELIRQIPSEEVLALSEKIRGLQSDVGEAVGVLFSKAV